MVAAIPMGAGLARKRFGRYRANKMFIPTALSTPTSRLSNRIAQLLASTIAGANIPLGEDDQSF